MTEKVRVTNLEKHASILLPLILLFTDYIAVISAEELAYRVRYLVVSNSWELQLSWINFWLVFPFLFLIFLHTEGLYVARRQFWQTVQSVFRS